MNLKVQEEIESIVRQMKDSMVETLQKLVRIPSTLGNEGKAQDFVKKQYEELGLEVHSFEANRQKIENHIAFNDSELSYLGRPNIIGILKGKPNKKSIILNGHVDVVSPEPIDQWEHDPWGGVVEGNRLFGRGAKDMKCGLVANIYAMKVLQKIGAQPEGTVILESVVEEEAGGGGGTLACFIEGYTGDGMIISEPIPEPCIASAGVLYFRIKVKGKTNHAARAHLGINAIGKIVNVYQALVQLDEQRAASVKFPLFEKRSGRSCHLNIGTLKAGDWPSTVAGFAEMECRIGFVPGENRSQIQKIVEKTVHGVAETDPWLREHPPTLEWFGIQADPWYLEPSSPLVNTVVSAVEKVRKEKAELVGTTGTADSRFSEYFGIPCVMFGPGGDNSHGIDEYVDLDTLSSSVKIIALAVLEWCSVNKAT